LQRRDVGVGRFTANAEHSFAELELLARRTEMRVHLGEVRENAGDLHV